jgi:hypothetical protein
MVTLNSWGLDSSGNTAHFILPPAPPATVEPRCDVCVCGMDGVVAGGGYRHNLRPRCSSEGFWTVTYGPIAWPNENQATTKCCIRHRGLKPKLGGKKGYNIIVVPHRQDALAC